MRKHYLYSTWYWLHNQQKRHQVEPDWADFETFISDIGERPSEKHRLRKFNSDLGYIRGNVGWNLMFKEQENNSWNHRNKDKFREYKLKYRYNITLEQYNQMLQTQNSKCLICGKDQTIDECLVVDHCHTTGKVRGLLCNNCNLLISFSNDKVDILQKAQDYLGMAY